MANGNLLRPDLKFIRQIISAGSSTLKKCFQCATCSVTCVSSHDNKPFPRKEMVWAQFGLKEKLLSDPDIWLCHQCSDCTVYCPRGAKPAEVLAAIRKMVVYHYAFPKFLAKMVSEARFLPILIAFPIILLLAILGFSGNLCIPQGKVVFSHFFPHTLIDAVFIPTALFVILIFGIGIVRFVRDMNVNSHTSPKQGLITSFIEVIIEILTHARFNKCELNKPRFIAHLGVFYGFIGLLIATALSGFYLYVLHLEGPYKMIDPLKIIANISAIAVLVGLTLMVINRFKNKAKTALGTYFDWSFIVVVYLVVISGILCQLLRLADIAILAYPMYFIHLVSVFYLFFYAPYSKLAHLVYRTIALIYDKQHQLEE